MPGCPLQEALVHLFLRLPWPLPVVSVTYVPTVAISGGYKPGRSISEHNIRGCRGWSLQWKNSCHDHCNGFLPIISKNPSDRPQSFKASQQRRGWLRKQRTSSSFQVIDKLPHFCTTWTSPKNVLLLEHESDCLSPFPSFPDLALVDCSKAPILINVRFSPSL